MTSSAGLPPIDQSLVPADVRRGGTKAVQLYDSAMAFEGMLDQQLGQALTDTLQPTDGEQPDASTSLLTELLPQAFSQALVEGGGLGLGTSIYQSLAGEETAT